MEIWIDLHLNVLAWLSTFDYLFLFFAPAPTEWSFRRSQRATSSRIFLNLLPIQIRAIKRGIQPCPRPYDPVEIRQVSAEMSSSTSLLLIHPLTLSFSTSLSLSKLYKCHFIMRLSSLRLFFPRLSPHCPPLCSPTAQIFPFFRLYSIFFFFCSPRQSCTNPSFCFHR